MYAHRVGNKVQGSFATSVSQVQVVGLQVALLSTACLGTAQFAADRATVSQAAAGATSTLDVRTLTSCSRLWLCQTEHVQLL